MQSSLRLVDDNGLQTLGLLGLDVDGLDVAVQSLLGVFLVVSLSADSDTESVWDTLDSLFPDLLVQLRVKANIFCALNRIY